MVQTRAAAKRIESGEPAQPDPIAPSPSKKRRQDGVVTFKKRHRGKPGELCQLNLDVLFLLASYVHPLDLLNLARTCKSLRELLMDKSSEFVWKSARRQVGGLPECPVDLTEPEYANLVFHARCHGCGKYAKKILWCLRRRYCPECRVARLCYSNSSPHFHYHQYVLPVEYLEVNGEKANWVDKEQLESIVREYERASDKDKFFREKRLEHDALYMHARECKEWEVTVALEHKYDLEARRQERFENIFERLDKHGYGPEIACFGRYELQQPHKSFFKTSKPLTDKEWEHMLPMWVETMKEFRSERIERTVYRPRRSTLESAYGNYLVSRSSDTPVLELLPHVSEIARFPPFREIIHAPEETEINQNSFEPAFELLPGLADEWKMQLDAEFSKMVEIPPHLSSKPVSSDKGLASSSATDAKSSRASIDKLRLACAVFQSKNYIGYHLGHYPDILSCVALQLLPYTRNEDAEHPPSTEQRFGVKFIVAAAHVVHACGLDPNVATADDMDRHNARLICQTCPRPCVLTWRAAIRHVFYSHPSSIPPRWERVSDDAMDAILAAELSLERKSYPPRMRCLACPPCVGCAAHTEEAIDHVVARHAVERGDVREGVHYKAVTLYEPLLGLEMATEGGVVTYKEPFPRVH